ncbi:MAG: hypothetical protein A2381_00680 [Bdellovibrionales bacterium RIFOXYB1_FULL_37_110]|nr:MAG: hypothetical protein A2417_01535 [Bdellovibrionales bacterium RIFOXYC1_FULL_37_79]OFZ58734.1 MAG: hypothetical protein A2381_00680 [Bdellovibrionales bacterium RIFOXYB1_FULL_37_110]OFZ64733.1 MAG: hypothetical protein A2577_06680 [Bdellovibrionales bacterium RIFOXYD1_FULL_36_51]
MPNMMRTFTLLIFLFSINSLFANSLTLEQKYSDFYQLVNTMKASYGPLQYKETQGIIFDNVVNEFKEKIEKTQTNGEFYYTIVEFVARFQDSHFSANLPTTHRATLGFYTDLVDGKVLIDSVNENFLPKDTFSFIKGDEIISINDQPVRELMNEIGKYISGGTKENRDRMSAIYVPIRPGSLLPVPLPNTKAKLKIRRGTSNIIEEVELPWIYTGEPIDEYDSTNKGLISPKHHDLDMLSVKDIWQNIYDDQLEVTYFCSGKTRVAIPKDATIIMKTPFVAYYHPTEKGNIGYLRIPHYYPQNETTGTWEGELRFAQYEYAIRELEKNTVGLVIDQDHNCGGSVDYLQSLVSLFIDTPFKPLQFQFRANKVNYLFYLKIANEYSSTIDGQNIKEIAELVKDAWQKGDFMTGMTSFSSNDLVYPNPKTRYTKPILMLIDENSGSGGDAFPSMMQGFGRAKLFGTRTMGAGGHVSEVPDLNYSGIKVKMTKSLFYRPDGVAVENHGAEPNIPYTITRDDFIYEYKGYQKAYLAALFEMIN